MSNQIVITSGAKLRDLDDVIVATDGILSSVAFNVANGVPRLDENGKILVSQLPNSVMEFKGVWNAATNTPTLANGTGNAGDVWLCNVAGTVNFGAGPIAFAVGDYAVYTGTVWAKSSGATGTVTSVGVSRDGNALAITGSPITSSGTINLGFSGDNTQYINGAGNLTTFPTLITSIGLTMPAAFNVSNSPLTANGTIGVTAAGYPSQYIRGDGTLADFPTSGGGGSSVSYYLNGGTSQGSIGGTTYYEMSKTADTGTGVDFSKTGDGLICAFLTDANDPALLQIPAGNWNYEIYASMSSNGGTPEMYAELYVYNGTTFTLISTSSHEILYDGVNLNLYSFACPVPETTLTITDRLAIKLYATNSGGKTTTIHTQDSHLCQVITTFSTGLTALNGLTAQVQYFGTGTSGSDFNIVSSVDTHTFNLPTASATKRGALSSADWSTFNGKQDQLNGTGFVKATGTTIYYDNSTYALDADVVHLTGNETIGGTKTFSNATKNNGGILLQNGSSYSASGYMNLGGMTNGLRFTSGLGISNYFALPSATGYTYTFPSASGTVALTSDLTGGTVTSVGLSAPTGFSVSGSPVTTSGTLALSFASGYSLPTNVKQSNWDDAYTWVAAFPTQTGNNGKFLTTDGSTLSWAANPLGTVTSVAMTVPTGLSIAGSPITSSGTLAVTFAAGYSIPTNASQTTWDTAYTNRITSLTTTGTSGAATLVANVLNIPNYGSALSGYVPYTGATNNVNLGVYSILAGNTSTFSNSSSLSAIFSNGGNPSNYNAIELRGGTAGTSPNWQISKDNSTGNAFELAASTTNGGTTYGSPVFKILNTGAATYSSSVTATSFIKTSGTSSQFLKADGSVDSTSYGTGSVTSVAMTVPTGLTISGTPITTSGTLAITLTAGYSIPTTASQTNWDTAYTNRITSLTTTGTSGAATLISNVLNIPNYAPDLSGYVTLATTQTISGAKTFTSTITATQINLGGGAAQNQLQNAVNNDFILSNSGNFRIINNTNTSALLTITNAGATTFSGNVGIGVSPLTKLHLQGASPNYILLTNTAADGVNSAIQGGIIGQSRGYANNLSQMASILFRNNATAWYKGEISFNTNNTDGTDPSVGTTEAMRIFSDGNILMQTGGTITNAGYKLDVNGSGRFSSNLTVSGNLILGSYVSSNITLNTDYKIIVRQASMTLDAVTPSYFGYSSGYGIVKLGSTDTNRSLAFNVDVTGNPSGAFSGNGSEYVWRNTGTFLTPNFTNNGYNKLFDWTTSGLMTFYQAATFNSSVTATSFFESSDSRLKTLIQDNYQIKGIGEITPKLYTKNGKVELGYYAQDFVGILDSAVSKGSDDMLSLSYREVHTAKIYALEQEIKKLKAKLN